MEIQVYPEKEIILRTHFMLKDACSLPPHEVGMIVTILQWGNRGTESLRDLSQVTPLVSGRNGFKARQPGSRTYTPSHHISGSHPVLCPSSDNHHSWMEAAAPYWLSAIQPQTGRHYAGRWHICLTTNIFRPKSSRKFQRKSWI